MLVYNVSSYTKGTVMDIYDIAKLAEVSTATVSRVMNNGRVSEKTRERVLRVMEENSYSPNVHARRMNLNASKTIGVVVTGLDRMFFSQAVAIIERELKKADYDISLYCTGSRIENVEKYIRFFKSRSADGIIFIGSIFKGIDNRAHLNKAALSVPVLFINAEPNSDNIYSVVANDVLAVSEAVAHLTEKGHRRFLYVYENETASGLKKLQGFNSGIQSCGLGSENCVTLRCARDIWVAKAEIAFILEKQPDITAIIASEDELAVGALKAAEALGIKVPERLAVIGYNNSVLALCCSPELTSIDNKIVSMCEISVKILMDALAGRETPRHISLDCDLIIREST